MKPPPRDADADHQLMTLSPEEKFADSVYNAGRARAEKKAFIMKTPPPYDTLLDLQKDTAALKQLDDLEELVDVPIERGGVHFSDWERQFIKSIRQQFNAHLDFTPKQRDKIKEVWQAVDLRKRAAPDESSKNLFSKLSPERQAEQRERAARVKLPWE